MPMTFSGPATGAWIRASASGTVSSPGSGLPPDSINSIISSCASGLISSPSNAPTRVSPPSTEYVTSFKRSPPPKRHSDTHLSSKAELPASLRLQTLQFPPSPGTPVDETVVQPVFAPLPELDGVGLDPVAAPERRAWDLTPLVLSLQRLYPLLQNFPVLNGPALLGSPRSEAASTRTAGEVSVGFFFRETASFSLDPDLPLQLAPVEEQGARGIGFKLAGLASLVVGVEDETAPVVALQEYGAGGGTAFTCGGGQYHGVRLVEVRVDYVLEPLVELGYGALGHVGFVQAGAGIFPSKDRGVHVRLPAPGSRGTLEGADYIGGDPTSIEISFLRPDLLPPDPTPVHPGWVESDVVCEAGKG